MQILNSFSEKNEFSIKELIEIFKRLEINL